MKAFIVDRYKSNSALRLGEMPEPGVLSIATSRAKRRRRLICFTGTPIPPICPAQYFARMSATCTWRTTSARPTRPSNAVFPIDLSQTEIPTFVFASREDHIVPWRTAYASTELLAGDVFVLGASGHIAGVINPASKNKRQHWVNDDAAPDPEHWLAHAQEVPGSWWPKWAEWLERHAGGEVPAPRASGSRKYRRIEPAPGRYVMEKAD